MNVRIFPVILLVILVEFSFAQHVEVDRNAPCGTSDLTDYVESMDYSPDNIQLRSGTTSYFPLNVVSVGTDNGEGHIDLIEIRKNLCLLNQDFSFLDIQFFIKDDIKKINKSAYYDHNKTNGFDMMRRNNIDDAFNIYIVSNPDSTCGYFAPSTPAIAIAKNCFEGGQHALTHEMGHYLGLYHTFYGWENITYDEKFVPKTLNIRGRDTLYTERVSGQYCAKASDGFCDTPPDYINSRWACDDDGKSLATYKDPDGVEFKVDGKNFMSYSLNSCQEYFSPQQANLMLFNLLDSQKGSFAHFKYNFVPDEEVSGEGVNIISPATNGEVDYSNVVLQWQGVAGSTHYQVEVSRFPGQLFNEDPNKISLITTNSFVNIESGQLRLDTKYYWKIYPLNPFTLCPIPSIEEKFVTRTQTNTQQFASGEKITISPNLLASGSETISIQVQVNQPKNMMIQLFDMQGKLVKQSDSRILQDENLSYELPNLAAGMYFFRFSDKNDFVIQKIIVQ